jgi:hypothetical protein
MPEIRATAHPADNGFNAEHGRSKVIAAKQ